MEGLLSASLIMPCAARPRMVTRDADTPPKGVRGLVTMAHALPRTPGRPGYLPCPG